MMRHTTNEGLAANVLAVDNKTTCINAIKIAIAYLTAVDRHISMSERCVDVESLHMIMIIRPLLIGGACQNFITRMFRWFG